MKILHTGRLVIALVLLTSLTSVYVPSSQRVAKAATGTSVFGVNYWPPDYSCQVLTDANWASQRSAVAADLDHIASLGGGVIRLMFWPEVCGFDLPQSGSATLKPEYYQETANLPDLLRLATERNIKVFVAFGNDYLTAGPTSGGQWWQYYYNDRPDQVAKFTAFLGDSGNWVDRLVDVVESSAYRTTVLYYDYQNEYHKTIPYMAWYLTYLYDWSHIPAGKRGASVLNVPDDDADMQYQLGSRQLNFVDFHSYPDISFNSDIEGIYDRLRSMFPGATVLLGEFGWQSNNGGEGRQQTEVINLANRARAKGIPYYLNWLLYDGIFGPSSGGYGWGDHDRHSPKNIMGGFSQVQHLVANGDMELTAVGQPQNWSAGGTIPVTLMAGGPAQSDAATNDWYGRLQVNGQSSGRVWMVSDLTPVQGGHRLYANSFIRSNMRDVRMEVVEYDAYYNSLTTDTGPTFTPTGWSFNNYLQRGGTWSVQLGSQTRYVIVLISATVMSNPAYLDVDTVSAWEDR